LVNDVNTTGRPYDDYDVTMTELEQPIESFALSAEFIM
jgi:hypothetical protein